MSQRMGLKACSRCKSTINGFYKNRRTPDGLDYHCKKCMDDDRKKRYVKNGHESGWSKAWWEKRGIDSKEVRRFRKEGPQQCMICGSTNKLCVDHCHTTKKLRGILCTHCNLALGHFSDNPDLLERARQYILQTSDR